VRHVLAARGRDALFFAAIAATVLLVAVAVTSIRSRWQDERAAMQRALVEELSDVGGALMEGFHSHRQLMELTLMAPVHGMVRAPGDAPLGLAQFARYTAEHMAGMELTDDAAYGVFRIDLDAPWPTAETLQGTGAMRDPEVAAAVLARLAERRDSLRAPIARVVQRRLTVRGEPLGLLYARERSTDGRVLAVLGVTYSPRRWYAHFGQKMVQLQALLPPTFYGVDWTTVQWARRDSTGRPRRDTFGQTDPRHNAVLNIRVTVGDSDVVFRTAGATTDPARERFHSSGAMQGGPRVDVWMSEERGHRLVAAAVPIGAEQWLIAGIAVLGALFVAATILELRRQHQLAEERRNFVSAVSHELRTPLAHMVLLSETMLGPIAQTAEQRQRWLHVIHRESMRLARLVDNVLLHARGEHHELPLERRWVDACDVVDEVVGHMGSAAAAHRTRLCAVTPAGCSVYVDPDALRQILLNLLDNAIKYGPDGQTVTITLGAPTVREPALSITVDDQGRGIPARDRGRIWSPFVRLEDRGSATGGSGLGLSVVRDLARRHGGRVEVQDAPGGGARLLLVLPQDDVADEAPLRLASG
jgi:signal transduction histidine kinase